MRHGFKTLGGDAKLIDLLFGPSSEGDREALHAGAVSFGDAQLVAFPVRSLRNGYVYASCPQALARTKRLLGMVGIDKRWTIPPIGEGQCALSDAQGLLSDQSKLHLEVFEYTSAPGHAAAVQAIAADLAADAVPADEGFEYFRDKFEKTPSRALRHRFRLFRRARDVGRTPCAHRRQDRNRRRGRPLLYRKPAARNRCWWRRCFASQTRAGNGPDKEMSAENVIAKIRNVLNGQVLQIGGDATTGRGLVKARILEA